MKELTLNLRQKRRASTLLALAQSELQAVQALCGAELFKEAVVHLYFTCYYASQALLVQHIAANPSHKYLETVLHKEYGRKRDFPRRYVQLHARLHVMRLDFDYKNAYSPDPDDVRIELRRLEKYVKFAFRVVPRIEIGEIVRGIFVDHEKKINDFSYDLYCPKTYKHHTRITIWQPPSYLEVFTHASLQRKKLQSDKVLRKHVDKAHIAISLQRGYSTLRITANDIKPQVPYFYKEL